MSAFGRVRVTGLLRLTLGVGTASGAVASVGCVARDAGYADVRHTTSDRIGRDVHWHELDGEGEAAKRTRELLAKPLTADSAVELSLLNSSALQAAFEELGVARAELVQALAVPNPSADLAVRFHSQSSRVRPEITVRALENLSGLIFIPLRNGVGSEKLEAAKASVAGAIVDVAFDTRRAFYEYQAATQILELRRTVEDATHASFDAAQRIHAAGNSTDLVVANERALYEESRILAARAETARATGREKLVAMMGLGGPGVDFTAPARLAEPPAIEFPVGTLEERALDRSLDLAVVRHRLEAAAKKANLARVEGLVPDLKVGVEAEREEEWALGPAAALSVPLFYQGQGEVGVALAEMRRERERYAHVAVQIRAAARATRERLTAARSAADYYKTILVPLRAQIVDDTQLEYNAMAVGVFQLLQAKRDQIETARAYVEQLRDYWIARSEAEELDAGRLVRGAVSGDAAQPTSAGTRPGPTE